MKKFLILCFLGLLIITTVLTAGAQDNFAVLTINAPQELPQAGETFEVTVSIGNNPGFCAIGNQQGC